MYEKLTKHIRSLYGDGFIPLHEPRFLGREKEFLLDCIDSTFVSSIGEYVDKSEQMLCDYTGSPFAVSVVNGTAALHTSLILADVKRGDEVLTQALTFVATANAISYQGAKPIFIDSAHNNLGLCPKDLENFLEKNTIIKNDGFCYNKKTDARIKACVPMHTFGHPVLLDEIIDICDKYNIFLIEDAAESLGSYYKKKHTGTIAPIGILSFNGNKVITSGGGGVLLIRDAKLAKRAKHLTTTAKITHPWNFVHDEIGYNYRLPNLNAALLCAQLESLDSYLKNKREVASSYREFFKDQEVDFIDEPQDCESNFWLNSILCQTKNQRDDLLNKTNTNKVMTRPVWELMSELPAFMDCQSTELTNAKTLRDRILNIPSSVRIKE